MKNIIVLDNGGKSFDRYTIIDKKTGDMIGASENPFHPQGFGQYCGNVADNYWIVAYGASWRRDSPNGLLRTRVNLAVNHFLNDCENVGKPIDFETLPEDVKKFALQSFKEAPAVVPDIEKGTASIKIELKKGCITVTHGTDGDVLYNVDNVPAGTWQKLWDAIKSLK